MKFIIQRSAKTVVVLEEDTFDACALGFHFAQEHSDLVVKGWAIYCHSKRQGLPDSNESGLTHYGSGHYRANDIARLIKAGPPPPPKPKHDCPSCECEPGCCK